MRNSKFTQYCKEAILYSLLDSIKDWRLYLMYCTEISKGFHINRYTCKTVWVIIWYNAKIDPRVTMHVIYSYVAPNKDAKDWQRGIREDDPKMELRKDCCCCDDHVKAAETWYHDYHGHVAYHASGWHSDVILEDRCDDLHLNVLLIWAPISFGEKSWLLLWSLDDHGNGYDAFDKEVRAKISH